MSFGGFGFGEGYFAGGPMVVLELHEGQPTEGLKLQGLADFSPTLANLRQRQPALTLRGSAPRVTNIKGE